MEKLLNNKKSDIIFCFDPVQNRGIQVEKHFFLESNKLNSFNEIKNLYFFRRVIWQSKIVRLCLSGSFNQAIFLGDMNILSTLIGLLICRLRRKKQFYGLTDFMETKTISKNN